MSAPYDSTDPVQVEAVNTRWWSIHGVDKPLHAQVPLADYPAISWPPRVKDEGGIERYDATLGPHIQAPFPVRGVALFGFQRPADLDRFVAAHGGERL